MSSKLKAKFGGVNINPAGLKAGDAPPKRQETEKDKREVIGDDEKAEEYFQVFNPTSVGHVDDDKTHVIKLKPAAASIYVAYHIKCNSNNIYKWQFKILNKPFETKIAIGIDEANHKWINDYFYDKNKTLNYSYCHDGDLCIQGNCIDGFADYYGSNDIVTMTVDCKSMQISWSKNKEQYQKVAIEPTKIGYKMAVYLGKYSNKTSIQLLSFSVINKKSKAEINEELKNLRAEIEYKQNEKDGIQYKINEAVMNDDFDVAAQLAPKKKKCVADIKELKLKIEKFEEELQQLIEAEARDDGDNTNKNPKKDDLECNKYEQRIQALETEIKKKSKEIEEYKQVNLRQQENILSLKKQIDANYTWWEC